MGLNDKLKAATDSATVETLLVLGSKFNDASAKTRRRWKSVAERRLKELAVAKEAKVAVDRKTEKKTRA